MTPTKIYGLIGNPISHSLSPLMHNAAFSYLEIGAEYRLFPLKEKEIESFLQVLSAKNIFGLNVTVPYKEKVIPYLNSITDEARVIGAVNTIKVAGKKLEGFNTDGAGFLKHLTEDLRFNPRGKKIGVIGSGGASRAVSVCLAKTHPEVIAIYDIDNVKLSALAEQLKENFRKINIRVVDSMQSLNINTLDLLINCTPVGMKETDQCLAGEELLHKGLLVYDLIYNPKETKLLKAAKEKGAKISNGLGMLLYQGMLAFEIWTNKKAPKQIMQEALRGGLK